MFELYTMPTLRFTLPLSKPDIKYCEKFIKFIPEFRYL